jgi:hypothetical protein
MSGADLVPQGTTALDAGQPLNGKQLRTRLAVIQDVMKNVMVKDVDYGVIPGTPKPTLFKPGAEKLCVTFRLAAADPQIVDVPDVLDDEIRYRVRVPILANGVVVAVGVGECSTSEEKYKWRRPVHIKEYENAPLDRKREKYQKNGDVWQQVRVEPADIANTVLKMAHNRAYVHAVIMATAAGSIFTQDVEDLPEGVSQEAHGEKRSPITPPQRRESAPAGAGTTVEIKVSNVTSMTGTNTKGPWEKWTLDGSDGKKYGTFDAKVRDVAQEAREAGLPVSVTFIEGKYGRDVLALSLVERQPGGEG